MKKLLIIPIAVFALGFRAEAQLLEDNQSRLKTAKVRSAGFLFFRDKKRVKTTVGGGKQKIVGQVSPRYSPKRISFKSKGQAPRFSSGSPFRSTDFRVFPRYSRGNPFQGSRYVVSPRFSPGMPFRSNDYRVAPRYSSGMPFEKFYFKVRPRYSNPKNRFVVNSRYRQIQRYYNVTADYKGKMKWAKRGSGDQHPSSNYHLAMKFSSPKIRKMFRKWNVFWVRVNGNKEQPKGVRASVRSPKFDRKEKDIWNN